MIARTLVCLPVLLVLALAAPGELFGHEGHDDEPADGNTTTAAARLPEGLVLPDLEGKKPWSDKPLLDDPDRFQIAIMTDRTGGHRPGIWMKGVESVNLLRPQFVVSVGDLIEGYSTDRKRVEAEWKEFLGFIDRMEMKFFFVAGNHDVSNPAMHDIWREHFGPEWYSFDYKRVHFLCLSSEDPQEHLGDEQLQWIERDLAEHVDARWTLVFLHKPLWVYAERAMAAGNADSTNWKKVEKLLGSRPHTVFSGHVHHYVQYDRNGMKYYHLATTGGGSRLRGVPYGEFDHVTWLTMEADEPHVTHLLLDGILPSDAVNEKGIARFRKFLAGAAVEIAPILLSGAEGFSEGRIQMRLANGFDAPIELSATIDGLPLRGLTVDPATLDLSAAPGETAELSVRVQFGETISFDHLAQTVLIAKLRTTGEDPPLSAERTIPVIIDQSHPCPPAAETVVIDGVLDEWGQLSLATPQQPLVLGPEGQWNGSGDASLRFALSRDDRFLYVGARVTDDRVLEEGDSLVLRLDTRPIVQRKTDGRLRAGTFRIAVSAPKDKGQCRIDIRGYRNAKIFEGAKAAGKRTGGGYEIEAAIPLEFITASQGADWQNFQLSAAVSDQDEASEKPARIVWRGSEQFDSRNTNFGHFVRGE